MNTVKIGDCWVGKGCPVLIIAEAGVNHNGDITLAHRLIDAAVEAGADAVKFQSFVTADLVTLDAQKAGYQTQAVGHAGCQFDMLRALELSHDHQKELKVHCDDAGILYLCTPYEEKSADFLADMGVVAYKIASTDVSNIPFLRYVSQKRIPMILSTGMSTIGEVEDAVSAVHAGGLEEGLILMQCTSEYPSPFQDMNLKAIKTMELAFDCPVGFSDHSSGIGASPWAVAAGACVIEKHFTLDRNMPGPDHQASIEPTEFSLLVRTIRDVEAAMGDGIKRPMPSELPNKVQMQKSLVATRCISAGEIIKKSDLGCKRPGCGLPPKWFDKVVGRRTLKKIQRDERIGLNSVDWTAGL